MQQRWIANTSAHNVVPLPGLGCGLCPSTDGAVLRVQIPGLTPTVLARRWPLAGVPHLALLGS